jgi:hypothetical protein
LRHLAQALVVSVVGAVVGAHEPGGEPLQGRSRVYAHPDHVAVGAPDAGDPAVMMVYEPVDEQSLAARLEALLAPS